MEIQLYLKTGIDFDSGKEVTYRNTDIAQAVNTPVCDHRVYLYWNLYRAVNSFCRF